MSINELLAFLLPGNNLVQLVFGLTMLVLTVWSIAGVLIYARPQTWARKWQNHAESNAFEFDADHGSINELSEAVASRAEKLADMMPGILLILGLLGTFLGLGVALNDAAVLLAHPPGDSAATADTMSGLTHMMSGLGTKFKTSTWGIISFLVLKAFSALCQYDEKRFQWCVDKFNQTLALSRTTRREQEEKYQDRLVGAIEALGERVIATVEEQSRQQGAGQAQILASLAGLGESSAAAARSSENMQRLFDVNLEAQLAALHSVADHTQKTRSALEGFIDANSANIEAMRDAGVRMSDGADGVAASAKALLEGVEGFKRDVASVLSTMQEDLSGNIAEMNASFQQNMSGMTDKLATVTTRIKDAVTALDQSVSTTMAEIRSTMETASENQNDAIREFEECSTEIQRITGKVQVAIENVAGSIKNGLASVADAGMRMRDIAESCVALASQNKAAIDSNTAQADIIRQAASTFSSVATGLAERKKDERMLNAINRLVDMRAESHESNRHRLEEIVALLDGIKEQTSAAPSIPEDSFQ
jgi:hypothetical protein